MNNKQKIIVKIFSILLVLILISGCVKETTRVEPNISIAKNETEEPIVEKISELNATEIHEEEIIYKNSVVIFVDEYTYNQLTNEIKRLKTDIENDLDVNVFLYNQIFNDPQQIRETIISHFNNDKLIGSILIGNIPFVLYGDTLSDFYYMDLDDKIDECYNNGKVDKSCLGIYPPGGLYPYIEIWSGRIKPTKSGQEGIEQIRSYLNKNHDYRNGRISYKKRITLLSLIHIFDYSYNQEDYNQLFHGFVENSLLYSENDINIIYNKDSSALKNNYVNSLNNQNEITFLNIHGTSNSEWFGGTTSLYSNEIETIKPNSMIYFLKSCSNGDFSSPDYIAGAYLFSGNSLVVIANSVVSMGVVDNRTFKNIGQLRLGIPIGDVYKHESCDLVCHLFGDPTLKLRSVDSINSPKLKIQDTIVNFGEHAFGTQAELDYKIRNDGNSKLIIEPAGYGAGGVGAKLNGEMISSYVPFYYTFEGRINKPIEVEPNSEIIIKLYFNLKDVPVDKGEYEGYFLEMPTNDPLKPWITITLKGKAI